MALDSEFHFHHKCHKLRLTYMCFVDDLMVFCRGDIAYIAYVKQALDDFGAWSRLFMNATKSKVYLGVYKMRFVTVSLLTVG